MIELVISVAIISFIMTALIFLFSSSIENFENLNHRLFVLQNARQGLLWLTFNISQAKEVEIVSSDNIKVTLFNDEIISFYLNNGVLYREKNTGVNPIAELNYLKFSRPQGENYIELELGSERDRYTYTIYTKIAPVGNLKNSR